MPTQRLLTLRAVTGFFSYRNKVFVIFMVVVVKLVSSPCVCSGVPALPWQISATFITSCFQVEDTVGERGWNYSSSLKSFLQASVGQKGREWEFCIWTDVQKPADSVRCRWNRVWQEASVPLSFDTDSLSHLKWTTPSSLGIAWLQ